MKKLIVLALLAVSAVAAQAQMMKSRTLMKRENPATWYVRAGLSINMLSGLSSDDKEHYNLYQGTSTSTSTGSKAGFEVDFGFNKPIGKAGAYWGMELGIGNRGGKLTVGEDSNDKYSFNTWSLNYSPVTFGYKYSLTDDIRLDVHLGAYALVDMSRKAKDDDGKELDADDTFDNRFDAGLQGGIGVWYKKFNLDVTYRHGFVGFVSMPYDALKSSAVMVRLGYAF